MRIVLGTLAACVVVGSAAAGTAPVARNLVATASVKAQLRATLLARIPAEQRSKVRGPMPGRTYYGSYGPTRYALAMFSFPRTGTTDQPELFVKPSGKAWQDRGDTGGCLSRIPAALLHVWHLVAGAC